VTSGMGVPDRAVVGDVQQPVRRLDRDRLPGEMTADVDSRVASSQFQGEIGIAFDVHETRAPLERYQGKTRPPIFEHGNAVAERVVLHRSGQARAEVKHVVPCHGARLSTALRPSQLFCRLL
jgi:hypothetical protein